MNKLGWIVAFVALAAPLAFGQNSPQQPYQFNFGQIPFGEASSKVLNLVKDLPQQQVLSDYSNPSSYDKGWHTLQSLPSSFDQYAVPLKDARFSVLVDDGINLAVARGWTITYPAASKTKYANAYFLKENDGSSKLLLVEKYLRRQSSTQDEYAVFQALAKIITRSMGKQSELQFSPYLFLGIPLGGTAEWDAKGSTVVLLAGEVVKTPVLIYIDDNLWKTYVEYNSAYFDAIKKKQQRNASNAAQGSF